MTHTFFENNTNYTVEETREVDQFTVEISFAPDDTQLDLLFDTDADYYPELIENLEWLLAAYDLSCAGQIRR